MEPLTRLVNEYRLEIRANNQTALYVRICEEGVDLWMEDFVEAQRSLVQLHHQSAKRMHQSNVVLAKAYVRHYQDRVDATNTLTDLFRRALNKYYQALPLESRMSLLKLV